MTPRNPIPPAQPNGASDQNARRGGLWRSTEASVLRILGALFAATAIVGIFAATLSSVATGVAIALLVLITLLLVYVFGRALRPNSHAALALTLPVAGGLALLCHSLWLASPEPSLGGTSWYSLKTLPPRAWLIVLLCIFPYVLSFSMALLIIVRHDYRRCVHVAEPGTDPCRGDPGATGDSRKDDERTWEKEQEDTRRRCWDHIEAEWEFERNRFAAIESAATQQAFMLGALTSLVLIVCALLITPLAYPRGEVSDLERQIALVAIAIASATASSFLLNGGRIMVRVASHEASSRMFAWAAKLQFASVLAAALLGMLVVTKLVYLDDKNEIPAAIVGGLLIGFLGGRAIQAIVERAAASLSGLTIAKTRVEETDLKKIDGVDMDDVDRFIEDGITSIYDLAHTPTPRLFFNTQYSLQTICDWQSQAILFETLQDSADTFRIAHGVRGAIDARRILAGGFKTHESGGSAGADQKQREDGDIPAPPDARAPPTAGRTPAPGNKNDATERAVAKLRGEVRLARELLLCDDRIERLELYKSAHLRICPHEHQCRWLAEFFGWAPPPPDEH